MKKIGILSGMGTRAGIMFTDKMISLANATCDQEFPEFILHNNSAVPDRTEAILNNGASPLEELSRSLRLFHENEVDMVVSTCITSYYFLNQLENAPRLKVIAPFNAVLDKVKKHYPGVSKIGLLASSGTITTKLFHDLFAEHGYEIITLSEDKQHSFMQSIYMPNGLKSAQISGEAMTLFHSVLQDMIMHPVDLIIGGCSEVQIGLKDARLQVPYIDAMDILAEEVINEYYKTEKNG